MSAKGRQPKHRGQIALLVGASGFLGSHLRDELVGRGVRVAGTCRRDDSAASLGLVRYAFPGDSPATLIGGAPIDYAMICARFAEPGLCDERSFVAGFEQLLASIRSGMRDPATSKIVYVSSDAVFSGHKGRYVETDTPRPTTDYGRRQFLAEQAIQQAGTPFLIVRPSYIFDAEAPARDKRLSHLEAAIRAGGPVKAYTNVFKSPVDVRSLARLIVENALAERTGILHAAAERKSIYQFFSDSLAALGLQEKSSLIVAELNAKPGDTSLSSHYGRSGQ
jgi:dTDP-4-dehydrorhamnose reductase